MRETNPFENVILPAEVQLPDGSWKVPFTKEQYEAVTDYLMTIGFMDNYVASSELERAEKQFENHIEKASLRVVDDEGRQLIDYQYDLHTLEGFAKEVIKAFLLLANPHPNEK